MIIMSKKNRNKNKSASPAAPSAPQPAASRVVAAEAGDTLKKDFLHLFAVILFIFALLGGIYFYDQQSGFLQTLTAQLFALF